MRPRLNHGARSYAAGRIGGHGLSHQWHRLVRAAGLPQAPRHFHHEVLAAEGAQPSWLSIHLGAVEVSFTDSREEQLRHFQQWLGAVQPYVTDGDEPRARWLRDLVEQLHRTIAALSP